MGKRRKKTNAPEAAPLETQEPPRQPHEEDISLDLSSLKAGLGKIHGWARDIGIERVALVFLLLLALGITFWIRIQPLGLGVTDDWADNNIRQNLHNQFAQQINQQYPLLPTDKRDALINQKVDEFLAQNPGQYADAKKTLSQQLKDVFEYQDAGGSTHVYLGDLDSYFWLRYTRNWLKTGTVCDAVTPAGQCRDMFMLAPVGSDTSRNPSLHVFAIGWLHLLITMFNHDFPLTATSMYIPILLGLLSVIPAFMIGKRMAGNTGGFFAAVLIAVNPMHLSRSMGSDNDGWNIMLPLWAAWFLIMAIESKDWKRASAYAAGCAVAISLHAAAWVGWWMPYLILMFAALGLFVYRTVRGLVRGVRKPWSDPVVRRTALVIGVVYVLAGIGATIAGDPNYLTKPIEAFSIGGNLDQAVGSEHWPNVLTTVAELNKSSLDGAIANLGGSLWFLASLVGLLLMMLPRRNWKLAHYGILAGGIIMYAYLVNATTLGKLASVILLATPVAAIFLMELVWGSGDDEQEAHLGAALIVLVWFLAATYATYSGVRFILMMIVPFGIAAGVLLGRIHEWITRLLAKELPKVAWAVPAIVLLLLCVVIIKPVEAGYGTARGFVPSIDDAWWDSLINIRDHTAPEAIINSWWDFGHWFKYVAERRVTADGTTQHTHVPLWLGKALITPNERESAGALRMLDCGSDAYPSPDWVYSAYGIAFQDLNDSIAAQAAVAKAITQSKDDARKTFLAAGLRPETIDKVLERTHCEAPEDYFITSSDMIGKAGVWAHFGLWDFTRAFVVDEVRGKPQDTAIKDIVERLNLTDTQARAMYMQVQGLRDADGAWNEGALNQWVSPWPGYLSSNWLACTKVANDTAIDCPAGIGLGQSNGQTTAIDGFRYNITSPQSSVAVLGVYANGQRIGGQSNTTPEAIIVADAKLSKLVFKDPSLPGVAVVIDVNQSRMLIASTPIAESLFTQLYYLDGRYNKVFKKFDDRSAFTGTRVVVWKVDWQELDRELAARSASSSADGG